MNQKVIAYLKKYYMGERKSCIMCGCDEESIPLIITMLLEHVGLPVEDFRDSAGAQYFTDMHYNGEGELVRRPLWVHSWTKCFCPKRMIEDLEKYINQGK